MEIGVWGINHKRASSSVREKVAISSKEIPLVLQRLHQFFKEVVFLATCNRTEVYFITEDVEKGRGILTNIFLSGQEKIKERFYLYLNIDAVRHLFEVAASLDSMVIGETQILGQVKDAYNVALHYKTTGKYLNRLFQHALRIAKRIRTETDIARGSHSIPSVSCKMASLKLNGLKNKKAMIIGAGKTGKITLQYLLKEGMSTIFVTSRTFKRAEELTKRFGGFPLNFKDCFGKMAECDLIISQTSSPHYIIRKENIRPERKKPQVFIDLAIPRDIEGDIAKLPGIFLYNLDSIQRLVDKDIEKRKMEAKRAYEIIEEELKNRKFCS